MSYINEYSPSTLEQAISIIVANLDDEEIAFIRKNKGNGLHHGFGTAIRNGWGLWDNDSILHKHFREVHGLGHADDMSGLILSGVCARLVHGYEFDLYKEVAKYKKHWIDYGIDPLTQEYLLTSA